MVFDGVPMDTGDAAPENDDFLLAPAHASVPPGVEHPRYRPAAPLRSLCSLREAALGPCHYRCLKLCLFRCSLTPPQCRLNRVTRRSAGVQSLRIRESGRASTPEERYLHGGCGDLCFLMPEVFLGPLPAKNDAMKRPVTTPTQRLGNRDHDSP